MCCKGSEELAGSDRNRHLWLIITGFGRPGENNCCLAKSFRNIAPASTVIPKWPTNHCQASWCCSCFCCCTGASEVNCCFGSGTYQALALSSLTVIYHHTFIGKKREEEVVTSSACFGLLPTIWASSVMIQLLEHLQVNHIRGSLHNVQPHFTKRFSG